MTETKPYNVLFICAGNSARSIIAEGLLNELGKGRFKAYSAGRHPKGTVHPLTLKELQNLRIPTDGFRSKAWEEFAAPEAPETDFVFTVCDQAAGEVCPVWSDTRACQTQQRSKGLTTRRRRHSRTQQLG